MGLRAKLLIAPAIAIAMLLAFAVSAFYGLSRQSAALDDIVQKQFAQYGASARIAQEVAVAHAGLHRILNWGATQDAEQVAEAIKRETERLNGASAEFRRFAASLDPSAEETRPAAEALEQLTQYAKHAATALDMAAVDVNMGMRKMQHAVEAYERLSARFGVLIDLQRRQAEASFNAARAAEYRALIVCSILFVIAVVASIATGLFMSGRILAPLRSASAIAQRIAVGDLRSTIDQRGSDETAQLLRALASMQDGLRAIVEKVGTGASAVAGAAQSMAASSGLIEEGSRKQSNAAQATAASIEQLSASIAAVADGAEQVRTVSEASLGHARDGANTLGDLDGEIHGMQLAVNEIAGAVSEFVRSARTIDGMTQQVTDIAEQTNLLALNAAIEAARAGAQGRGFAVVADEVRKLAEKSAAAAREINTVTQSLGERSERVNAALNRGNAALESSQAHAKAVSDVLIAGEGSANQASHGVGEITSSVREQRAAAEEIARNVEHIARMAEENVRAVSKATGAARNLGALAGELNESVGHFKLS